MSVRIGQWIHEDRCCMAKSHKAAAEGGCNCDGHRYNPEKDVGIRVLIPLGEECRDRPYEPQPFEIAGFELCAWKVKGGIVLGPNQKSGTRLADFPKEVRVAGATYTLESTRWQKNGFGWGIYV